MIRALPTRPILLICLLIAAGLSAGALLCGRAGGLTGLMLTADSGPGTGLRAEPRRVSAVDARDLWVGGPGPVRARWDGCWSVSATGSYALEVRSGDAVSVSLDGREVLARRPDARSRGVAAIVGLTRGFHTLSVTYEAATPGDLRLVWSPAGEAPRDLAPGSLFTTPPSARQQALGRLAHILGRLALAAWLGLALLLVVASSGAPG